MPVLLVEDAPEQTQSSVQKIWAGFHGCKTALRACLSACVKPASRAAFHFTDFFLIYFNLIVLISRLLQQFFAELEEYGEAPSRSVQETWLVGMPIFAGAFLLALVAKILNARQSHNHLAAQEYIYSLFSSGTLYMIGDLFSKNGRMAALPKIWFIVASIAGLPIMAGLFFKLVIPDTANHLVTSRNQLNALLSSYSSVGKCERFLNAIGGVSYGIAINVFFWSLNREIYNGSSPLDNWQKGIVGFVLLASAFFGARCTTDHPKTFQYGVMISKGLRDGARAYAAYSGILFMLMRYCNESKTFDITPNQRVILTIVGAIISTAMALFSALNTEFRFKENHDANVRIKQKLSGASHGLIKKLRGCCRKNAEEAREDQALMLV